TLDAILGATYVTERPSWSWGAQALGTFRSGENDNDYRLGNAAEASFWAAMRWNAATSGSLRLKARRVGNIHGTDPLLNPMMVPTADPDRRAGRTADLGLGINWIGQNGALRGHRFAFEFEVPVYQDLDGPQLEMDWMLTVGWQKAFE
ncbi:MAG: transporter, partial [Gammaproteobacteria bacterium]|nr:transporter [Gammaproteobacteria bacterium]